MRRRFRIALLAILVGLLPLRGMAAVIADLCGPQHGAATPAAHACCDEADAMQASTPHGNQGQFDEGSCSHCAACSVGVPVLSEFKPALPDAISGTPAIPFRDRRASGFVTEVLDRPPLPL